MGVSTHKTFCRFCHARCAREVDGEDGRVLSGRGDPESTRPSSTSTSIAQLAWQKRQKVLCVETPIIFLLSPGSYQTIELRRLTLLPVERSALHQH